MRAIFGLLLTAGLVGCDFGGRNDAKASLVSNSGGEVALADGTSLEFAITSEKYKQWDAAQRGISKRIAARFGAILNPDAPTEASISRSVSYLEGQPSARQAIDAAGMSVREFVVMTVALEQEMRLASGQPAQPHEPSQPYDFPPIDTTFIAPQPVAPAPQPMPLDTTLPLDSAFVLPRPRVDSFGTPRPPTPTVFRRDTAVVRRDTLIPRRDTLIPRRDTTPRAPVTPPVTRDTLRDTMPSSESLPPGSLLRT